MAWRTGAERTDRRRGVSARADAPGEGDGGTAAPGVGDLQAAFCATLVDEWVRCGLSHAVVCPGSRSTPLALALAADGRIAVHVRLDERSAGFTAVGIGLATGSPAAVVVTSGTAAAELHAAVLEADLAAVPLLVCTADRPPELHDVGAPQTADQTRLFGVAVRWFADPGVPAGEARHAWRSLAARSLSAASGGSGAPGPVHLNLPFREPLLGSADVGGMPEGRPDGRPWHTVAAPPAVPPPGLARALVTRGLLDRSRRGVISAGAGCGRPEGVLALARALGWPVLADPRSPLRTDVPEVVATADSLLRAEAFAEAHRPEVVLRLGARWASKVVAAHLAPADQVVVDPTGRWSDPELAADLVVRSDPGGFCRAVAAAASAGGAPSGSARWAASWREAEAVGRAAIDAALAPGESWGEPALARRLVAALPGGSDLVVSSSMPVRDVEAFGLPRHEPPRVLANRGVNGIDGVVSTALGVALALGEDVVPAGPAGWAACVAMGVLTAAPKPPLPPPKALSNIGVSTLDSGPGPISGVSGEKSLSAARS